MKRFVKCLVILSCFLFSIVGVVACGDSELMFLNDTLELNILDQQELEYSYNGKKSLDWSVDDSSVIKVEDGVVYALKQGQATVTVSSGKLSDSLTVTVKEVDTELLELSVEKPHVSMYVSNTFTLKPLFVYNEKNIENAQFNFESLSDKIVSVSNDGVITANSVGETEILINSSFLGKSAGCVVNVTVTPSGRVTLDKNNVTLDALGEFKGQQYKNTESVQATVTEKGVVNKAAALTWESKDSNIATIDGGVITAVSAGSTEITASYVGEDGILVKETLMVTVNHISSTLSTKTDVSKTEPIIVEDYLDNEEIDVVNAYLTDGMLNENLNILSGGVIDLSATDFIGDVTLVLESNTLKLKAPIYLWTTFISSVSELEVLLTATDGHYRLTEDLNLTDVDWTYENNVIFKGLLDGNNKTLTNFSPAGCGLFNKLGNGAKVANVNFVNAIVNADNSSVGIIASVVQENAVTEIENINGNIVINDDNCGGLIGLVYRNSALTVKSCNVHVYAKDTAATKGALVGAADGVVNLPTDASSTFISNLKLCGEAKNSDVSNSSKNNINKIETAKPIPLEKRDYFDVVYENETKIEFAAENVVKATIFGNAVTVTTYSGGGVEMSISQVEGYSVNSIEIVVETATGEKTYYAVPIFIGELKITKDNKELLKEVPEGTIILQEDIDLAGITWDTTVQFTGTLDGNGHTIKNLTTQANNGFYKGGDGAIIKNVAFTNVTITGTSGALFYQPKAITVDNVFIQITGGTGESGTGRPGAIFERGNYNSPVLIKDTVIYMPGTNSREAIFGYKTTGLATLTNVHVINLPNEDLSIQTVGGTPNVNSNSTYTFHADSVSFINAQKSLTQFLSDCANKYLGVVKISNENKTDLLNLNGSETVLLTEDIDLAGITWNTNVTFTGTFDGGNHAIKNLTTQESNGFFKSINGGKIKNVAFTNVSLALGSGTLCYRPDGAVTVENTFIQVISTSKAGGRVGAIFERSTAVAANNLTNLVISMPNMNSNEAIYGYQINGTSLLTNVHCIGISNSDNQGVCNAGQGYIANTSTCNFYADIANFNSATKTLTPFLTSCVATYLQNN